MQLYDKLSPLGTQVVLDAATACGVAAKVGKALTPPGDSAVCVKFKKVYAGQPGWDAIGKLDDAGFYADILTNGYSTECSQAFVEATVFTKYQAAQAALNINNQPE